MILSMLEAWAVWDNIVDSENDTLLHVAASRGLVLIVEELIEGDVDVDAVDGQGLSALYYAIEEEHIAVMRRLLRAGAHVDAWGGDRAGHDYGPKRTRKSCESLVHAVVRSGDLRLLNVLIEEGIDVDLEMRDTWGCTPLHIAAMLGDVKMMRALLDAGADPNAVDDTGRFVLHYAAGAQGPHAIVVLLDEGVDINETESWGMGPTALEIAMGALQCGSVCVLKEAGAQMRDRTMTSKKLKELCTCGASMSVIKYYRDEL